MKLATFNVNSIKSRQPIVLDWLTEQQPDVLMMQELKGLEFPTDVFANAGYTAHTVTQKSYNGVATLTRGDAQVIRTQLLPDDDQARYLEVSYQNLRLINIYAPNGNPLGSDKFTYKLRWLDALYARLAELRRDRIDTVVAGDFNIIPNPDDAATPKDWTQDALFQPESRAAYRAMLLLGFTDAIRARHSGPGIFTFWDYQAGAWPRNNGIRIDHILLSPRLADRLRDAQVDRAPRALEKPSDHTPVWVDLAPNP